MLKRLNTVKQLRDYINHLIWWMDTNKYYKQDYTLHCHDIDFTFENIDFDYFSIQLTDNKFAGGEASIDCDSYIKYELHDFVGDFDTDYQEFYGDAF
jgi:hypothetical protein